MLSGLKDKHNLLVDDVKSIDSSEPSEGGVERSEYLGIFTVVKIKL